ncbi:MAG: T9SS type A sorting domain-containing protein [Taibaiella sp.]|nr:T9SS type A sorting domain-containing protein [Taibaiella sp.]
MKIKSILLFGSALMIAGSSFAQSNVTTGGMKYTLLEEGTGTWCGYCPDGSQRIQQDVEPSFPRCIAVAFHNGDAMELSGDPFNNAYITGFPQGTVDRVPYSGNIGIGRGSWSAAVGARDGATPKFDVKMISTFDSVTRVVSITVRGKALVAATGKYRINAYIIEDSISSAAPNAQGSYMNTTAGSWYMGYGSPITPASRYAHMGVVRKVLATGDNIYGDTAFTNPAIGDSVSKTYSYTIPATSPFKYVKVVGLVQKYGSTTNDREIENSVKARVRLMWKVLPTTNVAQIAPMQEIEIFPNPASNNLRVEGQLSASVATRITITNMVGQVVSTQEFAAGGTQFSENISLSNFTSGVYFMNIANNGISVTKQFSVVK